MSDINKESCVGKIKIADEVIAVIAGTAAAEVEDVSFLSGNIKGDIAEAFGKKNLSKGVRVRLEDSEVSIYINLFIKPGKKVPIAAVEVQEKVKTAIETMTGLTVNEVNVNVLGIAPEKSKHLTEA